MSVNYQSPKTLSSGDPSCDPRPSAHVTSPPLFDLEPLDWTNPLFFPCEPATLPHTVNLSQLLVPPGNGDQYEYIGLSSPSLLSFPFSDPYLLDTPAVPTVGEQSRSEGSISCTHKRVDTLSSDLPFNASSADTSSDEECSDSASDISSAKPTTSRHVRHALSSREVKDHSEHGVAHDLHGHPVLRYPNGSFQCISIVTASGKVSQYTQKNELPPDVGQPCRQTFRGRDEIVRHLKTTRWHRKLDEENKPLTCKSCGQQLSRRDALLRHMRSLHPSTLFILHRLVNKVLTFAPTLLP